MARAADAISEDSVLLCEGCGYILTGLPLDSRCPECAKLIAESAPTLRGLPDWERPEAPAFAGFWRTTWAVIGHPTRFYRSLATRCNMKLSRRFGWIHILIASALLGAASCAQFLWLIELPSTQRMIIRNVRVNLPGGMTSNLMLLTALLLGSLACLIFLLIVTRLAARLTAWEANLRGLRLPHQVILRGLHYHAAHYLPVSIIALLTVGGYMMLLGHRILDGLSGPRYLYLLSLEVLLAAVYLFKTYWIGMRNMMFANR